MDFGSLSRGRGLCLLALLPAFAAVAEVRIAFEPAGLTDIDRPEHRVKISLTRFLGDALTRDSHFRVVSGDRAAAAWKRIRSGAYAAGTNSLFETFNRICPVDILCDCRMESDRRRVVLEVHTRDGVRREVLRDGGTSQPQAERLLAMVLAAARAPSATVTRLKDFAKSRDRAFEAMYYAPMIVGHYIDNTGETRMNALKSMMSASRGDPRVSAQVAEAAYWATGDGRKCMKISREKLTAMGETACLAALGAENEDVMRAFVTLKTLSASFERELLAAARGADELAELEIGMPSGDDFPDGMPVPGGTPSGRKFALPPEVVARGAMKALGWRRTAAALPLLVRAAADARPQTRRTAAVALGNFVSSPEALAALTKLLADGDVQTAILAAWSLKTADRTPGCGPALARRALDAGDPKAGGRSLDAVEAALSLLIDAAGTDDISRFERWRASPSPAIRCLAVRGLVTADPGAAVRCLDDADAGVVAEALKAVKPERMKEDRILAGKVGVLARDLSARVADAARTLLESERPAGGMALDRFRLACGSLYERRQVVRNCAAGGSADEIAVIEEACVNAEPQIRALALRMLLRLNAKRAHACALGRLGDDHALVRFHAARVLAATAVAADADSLESAWQQEGNRVARLYLADALARAQGRPLPPPRPTVNSIESHGHAVSWMCADDSPVADLELHGGYYTCSPPKMLSEKMRRAHDVRKAAIFPRPTPCLNPAFILLDPVTADGYWTTLDHQLPDPVLDYVDGVVYGEETMQFAVNDALWQKGWRAFCAEAGIDLLRVRGDRSKLTTAEAAAWQDWGLRVCIEGFGELYDFTKDYFGKLRPGIKVCTYMPEAFGETPYDDIFRFDVAGAYVYDGDPRSMFALCRKLKTTWPDRPIQWLSYGNVNIGLGHSASPKPCTYRTPVPTGPVSRRFEHCYADSFAVWLAGADTGYFTVYGFGSPDARSTWYLKQADIRPESGALRGIVNGVFAGVDAVYRTAAERADLGEDLDVSLGLDSPGGEALTLEEDATKADASAVRASAERERFRRGLLFMNRMTRDTVACEAGLPRRPFEQSRAFCLGGSCYTPAGQLLPFFDQLGNFSQPVRRGTLNGYRLGVLAGCAATPMTEATRQGWIAWLKETSAVLVVNGWLSPGTEHPYRSAACVEGDLRTPWPWERDVRRTAERRNGRKVVSPQRYAVTGPGCRVLSKDTHGATRVVWRGEGFKGTVVFDLDRTADARRTMYALLRKLLGEEAEPILGEFHPGRLAGGANGLSVEVFSRGSCTTNVCQGFELLTGAYNPKVTPHFNCAAVATNYASTCVAIHGGVCVVSLDSPLELVERLPDGVKVRATGLVRVTTENGRLPLITGVRLPEVAEDPEGWFVAGTDEGVATLPARGAVECLRWPERDEIPAWRVLRLARPAELVIRQTSR